MKLPPAFVGRLGLACFFPLGKAESGDELFETLLAEKTAELGAPAMRDAGSVRWEGGGASLIIERVEAGEGREIGLRMEGRP